MDDFAALKENPLLQGFSDDGVRIIRSAVTVRRLEAHAPVFVEKMHGESAFLIGTGAVDLFIVRGSGERVLTTLRSPDHFGELSLLQPGPRRISARTAEETTLFEITRRDFVKLQRQRPQACLKFMVNLVNRFAARVSDTGTLLERVAEYG